MFPIEPGKDYAVITGDVIGSSNLAAGERRKLPGVLRDAREALVAWVGEETVAPIAVFGGDSWQLLLAGYPTALHQALFFRAWLMASPLEIDVRMAIAIGGVDFVHGDAIEEADGEAFRLSGRLLKEGLPRHTAIGFASRNPDVTRQWNLVFRLIDSLVRTSWTSSRARAVSGAIRSQTQEEIGRLWSKPITKQAVSRHLAEARWDGLRFALDEFSSSLSESTQIERRVKTIAPSDRVWLVANIV